MDVRWMCRVFRLVSVDMRYLAERAVQCLCTVSRTHRTRHDARHPRYFSGGNTTSHNYTIFYGLYSGILYT
jgi:hypothetical protein